MNKEDRKIVDGIKNARTTIINENSKREFQSGSSPERRKIREGIEASRKICQIDEEGNWVADFYNVKEIAEIFASSRTRFDQALRLGFKAHGFFWMFKSDWDAGRRPDLTKQHRNIEIYVYNPYIFRSPLRKSPDKFIWNRFEFIGRYANAVEAAKALDISVSNIRLVAQRKQEIHKGYWFNFSPLEENHSFIANMKEAYVRELHLITKKGRGIFTKAHIYPNFDFKIKIFENEEDNIKEQIITSTSIEDVKYMIDDIIDLTNKLQKRRNLLNDLY